MKYFRVVLVISESKLGDSKAKYLREILGEMKYLVGIEEYLNYVDILVIEKSMERDFIRGLQKFAKEDLDTKFSKTLELIVNLLFNFKDNYIDEGIFFQEIKTKEGISSNYLSLRNNNIDIAS